MTTRNKDLAMIALGFAIGIPACFLLNWRSFVNDQCAGIDCRSTLGFPIPFYQKGGWVYSENILSSALVLDIVFWVIVSILAGLIIRYLWMKKERPI